MNNKEYITDYLIHLIIILGLLLNFTRANDLIFLSLSLVSLVMLFWMISILIMPVKTYKELKVKNKWYIMKQTILVSLFVSEIILLVSSGYIVIASGYSATFIVSYLKFKVFA